MNCEKKREKKGRKLRKEGGKGNKGAEWEGKGQRKWRSIGAIGGPGDHPIALLQPRLYGRSLGELKINPLLSPGPQTL